MKSRKRSAQVMWSKYVVVERVVGIYAEFRVGVGVGVRVVR